MILRSLLLLPLCGCICLSGAGRAGGEAGAPAARTATPAGQAEAASMRPLWSVSGYHLGQGAGIPEQEARSQLFKALDLTQGEITFDGRRCRTGALQRRKVDPARFLPLAWRVTPEELGIAEREIEVVRTECALPGFREYLRLQGNRLVIRVEGVFYFFDPVWNR
jgi:hypothetical protein